MLRILWLRSSLLTGFRLDCVQIGFDQAFASKRNCRESAAEWLGRRKAAYLSECASHGSPATAILPS